MSTKIVRVILAVVLVFFITENYLRLTGYHIPDPNKGESCHVIDHELGWLPLAGTSYSPEDPTALTTVWLNQERASRPQEAKPQAKKSVLVLGCSYTFGMGVQDSETFVWKLNQRFPNIRFDNAGVIGYSTYQCLLYEKRILQKEPYDLVLYAGIADHIQRNMSMRVFGLNTQRAGFIATPYIEGQSGHYTYHPVELLEWPGVNSFALIHFLCSAHIGRITEETRLNFEKHPDEKRVLIVELLHEMQAVAHKHDAKFALVALDGTELYHLPSDLTTPSSLCDAEFPELSAPQNRVGGRFQNHPNGAVHTFWAQRIGDWIQAQGYAN